MTIFRSSMSKIIWSCIIIVAILIGLAMFWINREPTWYGYVVGPDHQIYMINLSEGEVEWISRPLQQAGNPTEIDLNDEDSILYIAYGSYTPRTDYFPLMAIKLNEEAEVVFKHEIADNPEIISPAYNLFYNSITKEIYISYIRSPDLIDKVDSRTGEFIGSIDIPIRKQYELSQDGLMIAESFPGRTQVSDEGIEFTTGIVLVRSLLSGETISRTQHLNNSDLYPPWDVLENRYIHVREVYGELISRLEVFDRSTGEKLAQHDFRDTFGGLPNQGHVTRIPGTDDVAMSIGTSVIVFDPLTAEIKSKTYIGSFPSSEVVVTRKPLIRNESDRIFFP